MKKTRIRLILTALFITVFFATTALTLHEDSLPSQASVSDEPVALATPEEEEVPVDSDEEGYVICIDAGHQGRADMDKEPVGPGATTTKAKVDGGTCGIKTGLTEYNLNLSIALKLQKKLEDSGYTVIMTRTSNDVNLSNSERALMANEAQADAFIRIHADGCDIKSVNGATALCQTEENQYTQHYEESRLLADSIVNGVSDATGCKNRGVTETDTMTGINWSQVPTAVIEVGYLSNPEEEALLNTDEYQSLIAKGIADGVEKYFVETSKEGF